MIYGSNTLHRRYTLKNPNKYMEKIAPPICKSSWEERIFLAMDVNPYIIRWGYEPFSIYYDSPKTKSKDIYKPDVYCECDNGKGGVDKWLIEIKPQKFSVLPKEPKPPKPNLTPKQLARYNKKVARYNEQKFEVIVNHAKWHAARKWCEKMKINWLVLTEQNVNGLFAKNAHI